MMRGLILPDASLCDTPRRRPGRARGAPPAGDRSKPRAIPAGISPATQKNKIGKLTPPSGAASYCARAHPPEGVSRTSASGMGERWPRVMRIEGCRTYTSPEAAQAVSSRSDGFAEREPLEASGYGGSNRYAGAEVPQRWVAKSAHRVSHGASLKHRARDAGRRRTCGTTNCLDVARCRGSRVPRDPGVPRPLGLNRARAANGRKARPAPSQIRAAERWLTARCGRFDD